MGSEMCIRDSRRSASSLGFFSLRDRSRWLALGSWPPRSEPSAFSFGRGDRLPGLLDWLANVRPQDSRSASSSFVVAALRFAANSKECVSAVGRNLAPFCRGRGFWTRLARVLSTAAASRTTAFRLGSAMIFACSSSCCRRLLGRAATDDLRLRRALGAAHDGRTCANHLT